MQQEELYDSAYYHTSCGEVPYEQTKVWESFFASVADNIVRTLAPATVLDVGCAMGYLVGALRDRGVQAYGIDVSKYAISCVREDIKPFCFVASALEELPQNIPHHYELVTTIEVIEHLFESDCEIFLSNICKYSDNIIFSSSPDDVTEKTHFNVQQAEYWAKKMAQLGYYRDLNYDVGYIAPQAVRFVKKNIPNTELVEYFEKHIRMEKSRWQCETNNTKLLLNGEIESLIRIRDDNAIAIKRLSDENNMLDNRLTKLISQNNALNVELKQIQRDNTKVRNELAFKTTQYDVISNSACWKMTKPIRFILDHMKRTIFAKGIISLKRSGIKHTFRKMLQRFKTANASKKISQRSTLPQDELQKQRETKFSQCIKFSIVVPLYNTPKKFLEEMILSVQDQTYANWELCLADGSTEGLNDVALICEAFANNDNRIQYKRLQCNRGISGNTNECIAMATGEYIALLDHDDMLHPAALYELMHAICERQADFIYTDELVFEKDISLPVTVHFKPDFAIDNLRANNYICHFTAFKRSLLNAVGEFSPAHDGSQDHDMFLKLTQCATCIVHIPKVLYYWRSHSGSVASGVEVKSYCIDSGVKAVSDHLKRVGLLGNVEPVPSAGPIYRIRYELNEKPLISIIIYGGSKNTSECLKSVQAHTSYENYEIIVEKTAEIQHSNVQNLLCVRSMGMNSSEMMNYMANLSSGKYLLFLDSRMRVESPEWIEELLMYAQREDVGAVGAKAYAANNTIHHAGILVNSGSISRIYEGLDCYNMGYMGRLMYTQNLSAVSACCMMVFKADFVKMGYFDKKLSTLFDVDLCLKLRNYGKLIIFTPYAVVRCYDNKRAMISHQDEQYLIDAHKDTVVGYDPYYNPNFAKLSNDFSLL